MLHHRWHGTSIWWQSIASAWLLLVQVAISEREGGSQEGEGYDVADEDLDLDSYINELSAEVEVGLWEGVCGVMG